MRDNALEEYWNTMHAICIENGCCFLFYIVHVSRLLNYIYIHIRNQSMKIDIRIYIYVISQYLICIQRHRTSPSIPINDPNSRLHPLDNPF